MNLLEETPLRVRRFESQGFELSRDVFGREHSAARSGAASFEQVVSQVFDVGSQFVLVYLRSGQLSVARFVQQRAVFRHYLVEGGRRRRGRFTTHGAACAFGTAAAAPGARAF